jgi:voltage-gated potassium channel
MPGFFRHEAPFRPGEGRQCASCVAGTTGRRNPRGIPAPTRIGWNDRGVGSYMTPRLESWQRRTDALMLTLAIGTLPLLLLELQRSDLTSGDRLFMDVVNVVVLVAFALDYLVEALLASDRRAYVRAEWTSLLIVVSQALALLPALAGLGALRALRAARAARPAIAVARVIAIGGAVAREGRSILRRHAAGFALAVAGMTWLTSAVAFTLVEDVGEEGRLHSFFDALWWSSTTITTVGYGDVFPTTAAGRIVGVMTMVVGISTFAVVTAKVAEYLVRSADS